MKKRFHSGDQDKDEYRHGGDELTLSPDANEHRDDDTVTDEEWMERVHRIGDTCCADE